MIVTCMHRRRGGPAAGEYRVHVPALTRRSQQDKFEEEHISSRSTRGKRSRRREVRDSSIRTARAPIDVRGCGSSVVEAQARLCPRDARRQPGLSPHCMWMASQIPQ